MSSALALHRNLSTRIHSIAKPLILIPFKFRSNPKHHVRSARRSSPTGIATIRGVGQTSPAKIGHSTDIPPVLELKPTADISSCGYSRFVLIGTVSVGLLMFMMGFDGEKALAFGPEGPMVEEFWDNVRRYALYALTVSTGAIYTIFQPILELLKNPISAILVLTIIGGSIYIVSQVLSAMVGFTDFTYDYGY